MTVRWMAVAGPLEGATFPLPEGDFTIGRDIDDALCVPADVPHLIDQQPHWAVVVRDDDVDVGVVVAVAERSGR